VGEGAFAFSGCHTVLVFKADAFGLRVTLRVSPEHCAAACLRRDGNIAVSLDVIMLQQSLLSEELFVRDHRGQYRVASDSELYAATKFRLERSVQREAGISQPSEAADYLVSHFAGYEREAFVVLHLDTRHRVLSIEEASLGTINGASVYPREIVKSVLSRNSSAVIFAHNHPSGVPDPSEADRRLTERLREALSLVDVRVLDHLVVAGGEYVSFSQRGLL